jgi:hypothetical protein
MKLRIALFFLILTYNAFVGAFTSMVLPAADRPSRVFTLAGDVLMIAVAVPTFIRQRTFYGVKCFLGLVLASTLTFIYNYQTVGLTAHLNGIRQLLFFLAALVVIHDILASQYRDSFGRWFTRFLVVFALVQIPLAAIQFAQFGAGDEVGGTYGTTGGSGYLSQLAFMITFYMIVRYGSLDDGGTFSIRKTILFSLLLVPVALNETKISFVYMALFIALLVLSRSKAYKAIPLLAVGAGLLYLLNTVYTESAQDTTQIFDEKYLDKYLVYDPTNTVDVPRFQKVVLMFKRLSSDPGSMLLGLGYGLFGGGSVLGTTGFARSLWYFSGSRILLNGIWLQGGLVATVIIAIAMFAFLRKGDRLRSSTMRRFRWFIAAILVSMWLYNEAIMDRTIAMIASFFIVWISTGGIEAEDTAYDVEPALQDTTSLPQENT